MHQQINVYLLMKNNRIGRFLFSKEILFFFIDLFRSPYGREYELMCELSTAHLLSYKSPILWKFQTQSAY
jgi:hypothetical protein